MECTGDILWFMWVLEEKCLGSPLMIFFLFRRIRRPSYLANN